MTTTDKRNIKIGKTLYAIHSREVTKAANGKAAVTYKIQRIGTAGQLIGEIKTLCFGAFSRTYSLYSGRVGLPKVVSPIFKAPLAPITVEEMERPVHCGDWHDKPHRYKVNGPGGHQTFPTKGDANRFASIYRKSDSLLQAIHTAARLP